MIEYLSLIETSTRILSLESSELDRNYSPSVCDWLYSTWKPGTLPVHCIWKLYILLYVVMLFSQIAGVSGLSSAGRLCLCIYVDAWWLGAVCVWNSKLYQFVYEDCVKWWLQWGRLFLDEHDYCRWKQKTPAEKCVWICSVYIIIDCPEQCVMGFFLTH